MSAELMLIALVLAFGLITGWVKLRDQSLSEIADSMAAIDAFILGSAPLWQTGGTRWISAAGLIVEPASPTVTESWDGETGSMAVETSSDPRVFEADGGVLIYSGIAAETP